MDAAKKVAEDEVTKRKILQRGIDFKPDDIESVQNAKVRKMDSMRQAVLRQGGGFCVKDCVDVVTLDVAAVRMGRAVDAKKVRVYSRGF